MSNAKESQQEAYKEATGSKRLVQYFDKGRMELTNGAVTNGLLASEIVKGQIQVGDATFQAQSSPAIAIADDPSATGATYAALNTTASGVLAPGATKVGQVINTTVTDFGALGSVALPPLPETTITVFDAATQHNVPGAFAAYREKAGLAAIGYAISEPFHANVNVGGLARFVMIQVFERRVLTYTDTNPDGFKVEMGNIGQHYYQWRYASGAPSASAGQKLATWTNPRGFIQLQYPSDWTASISIQANVAIILKSPPIQRETLGVIMYVPAKLSLDGNVAGFKDSLQMDTKYTSTIHEQRNVTVGGEPVVYLYLTATSVSTTESTATYEIKEWIVLHNGNSFGLEAHYHGSPPADIDAIIASVVFLK